MAGVHKKVVRRMRRRGLHRFDRAESDVVQMRPAWADSVLLYWGSPVAYEDSGLDDDLIAELEAWDTHYYDRVGADGQWRSQALHDAHQTEGVRLARLVADALGRQFAVEFEQRTMRSRRRPAVPAAAAAFSAHGHQREAELHTIMDQVVQDSTDADDDPAPERVAASRPGQWLREVRSETTRRVRVRLSPDFAVGFPVEVVVNGQAGYVDGDMLGISASLTHDLEDFQERWERHAWDDDELDDDDDGPDDPECATWLQQGSRLVERLQAELGNDYYVTGT
jgi:hypothetical protein